MSFNCFQRFVRSVATIKANFHGLKKFIIWKEDDSEQEEEAEPFLNEQIHNFSHYREMLLGNN